MRILYLMKTQDSNLGDLLINKLLIDLLAEKAAMLFDVSGVSKTFREGLIADVSNPVIFSTQRGLGYYWKLLRCRKYFDVIVAPPGHAGKASWRHIVPIVFAIYYRLRGVRYMRLGKSIPQNSGLGAWLEKLLVRLSHHTMVRDQGSLERIRSFKDQRNISCAPDLIVLLSGKEPPATANPGGLVVSFRFDYYPEATRPAFVQQVAALAAHYANQHALPVTLTWQVERDEACVRAIAAELHAMGIATTLSEITLANLATTYCSAALILSNRLHVALTSLSLGANAWAVCDPAKDHKIIDAFQELQLGDRLLSIDQRNDLLSPAAAHVNLRPARDTLRAAILATLD